MPQIMDSACGDFCLCCQFFCLLLFVDITYLFHARIKVTEPSFHPNLVQSHQAVRLSCPNLWQNNTVISAVQIFQTKRLDMKLSLNSSETYSESKSRFKPQHLQQLVEKKCKGQICCVHKQKCISYHSSKYSCVLSDQILWMYLASVGGETIFNLRRNVYF